jgi:hypothetical protein
MNTACCSRATGPDPYALVNFQTSHLSRGSLDLRANAGISVVTADGDKITLSANYSVQASLETYDFLGRIQGQTVAAHGEKFQLATTSGFAVTVDGTLDQEELADINKLLDTIASISKDFFSGNTQDALKHLAEIDNLDSIASFDATLNYSRGTSAQATSQVSGTAPAASLDRSEAVPAAPAKRFHAADSFIDQLARAAEKLDSDEGHEKIPKRFVQLFKKIAHHLPLDTQDQRLAERIQSERSKREPNRHTDTPAQEVN